MNARPYQYLPSDLRIPAEVMRQKTATGHGVLIRNREHRCIGGEWFGGDEKAAMQFAQILRRIFRCGGTVIY